MTTVLPRVLLHVNNATGSRETLLAGTLTVTVMVSPHEALLTSTLVSPLTAMLVDAPVIVVVASVSEMACFAEAVVLS
jgi:hypothetical protein